MISAHTPPGTHVVALESAPEIAKGVTYVTGKVLPGQLDTGEITYGVEIVGHAPKVTRFAFGFWPVTMAGIYAPRLFDYAVLPKCLIELTTKAPDPALLKEVETAG